MTVVPSTVASLFETAGELLLVMEDALAETVGGTPERSYVAPSEPAFDCCPFLVVYVAGLSEAPTASGGIGGNRSVTGSVILATYQVVAVRCAPEPASGSGLPSLTSIEAAARQVQEDGWALWNRMRSAVRCEEIFGNCTEVYLDGGVPVPEQGGCVGWIFTIRATLPGIPRECPSDDPVIVVEEAPFEDDGPLADPWSDALELGYTGDTPDATGGVVTGTEGVASAAATRPDLAPATIVGIRAESDWSTAGLEAGVALLLAVDSTEWYELDLVATGGGFVARGYRVSDSGGTYDEVIAETGIADIAEGAAVALQIDGSTMRVLVAATGLTEDLAEVESGAIAVPLAGDLIPGFAVLSDASVGGFFTGTVA